MSFNSNINGHKIILDAEEKFGGKDFGPRPKPLMLLALSGCTGMDVVSLLKKMHVNFDDFYIDVKGVLSDKHPIFYKEVILTYNILGADIDEKKVEKAIKLSQEKYCGVNYMIAQSSIIKYNINYLTIAKPKK
jgi:putative redox protein